MLLRRWLGSRPDCRPQPFLTNQTMYNLETTGRPGISMLMGNDPSGVRMLEAFHKSLGRPESHLTYGDSFSLHIAKGQTIKESLTLAAEDLQHPDSDAPSAAREHVSALIASF